MMTPFFVVGAGRTGTTLLRAILDAREDVRIPGETHFYTTYRIENFARYHFLTRANYMKAVRQYPAWRHVAYEQVDWDLFREIARNSLAQRGSVLRAYLEACAQAAGASWVGEKTPGHIRELSRIWRDFPSARVVHVMRDPRGVAASYLDHDIYASVYGADVTRAVSKWVEAARIHSRVKEDDHYMLLRYEDLVETPASEIERVQAFLGLPDDPEILRKYETSRLVVLGESNHRRINRPVCTDRRDAWAKRLSDKDIELIEGMTEGLLDEFGYEVAKQEGASSLRIAWRKAKCIAMFGSYGVGRMIRTMRVSGR